MTESKKFQFTSASLHIMAMFFMLIDHIGFTLLTEYEWMRCVGRLAFPIFAFMTVEGYYHTHNLKKYILRLLVFALVSEIPFNLMASGHIFYLQYQNVMWTFIIGLLCIHALETVKNSGKHNAFVTAVFSALTVIACTIFGFIVMSDYYGFGVLMVMIFYFFREKTWYNFIAQFAAMYGLNAVLMRGSIIDVTIAGYKINLALQGFAILALIPIWLYRGKQGYHSRWFQYACYAFYPVHTFILGITAIIL